MTREQCEHQEECLARIKYKVSCPERLECCTFYKVYEQIDVEFHELDRLMEEGKTLRGRVI